LVQEFLRPDALCGVAINGDKFAKRTLDRLLVDQQANTVGLIVCRAQQLVWLEFNNYRQG
jgi:hypothetical protein